MTTHPDIPETAVIGRISRNQTAMSIALYQDASPDRAGMTLLEHYSEESQIDLLMEFGSREHLTPDPGDAAREDPDFTSFKPSPAPNTTEQFFKTYWDPCDAWLYVWTPDGWLGCQAMGHQMSEHHINNHTEGKNCSSLCYTDNYPKDGTPKQNQTRWHKMVGEFQVPEPLVKVIKDHITLNTDQIPGHQAILDRLNGEEQK